MNLHINFWPNLLLTKLKEVIDYPFKCVVIYYSDFTFLGTGDTT